MDRIQEISEQLEIVPMQIRVIKHVRKVYGCRDCETPPFMERLHRNVAMLKFYRNIHFDLLRLFIASSLFLLLSLRWKRFSMVNLSGEFIIPRESVGPYLRGGYRPAIVQTV